MVFKAGISGNPKGRVKGNPNRRTQLGKLLEPHAEKLINKLIEMAMKGDGVAMKLCMERLVPRVRQESSGIELPKDLNDKNMAKINEEIIRAAFDGRVPLDDAEKLKALITNSNNNSVSLVINTTDPIEASKIYQKIMLGE